MPSPEIPHLGIYPEELIHYGPKELTEKFHRGVLLVYKNLTSAEAGSSRNV